MKLWHVTFTCYGFNCNAVVAHVSRGEAIALLRLDRECREVEAVEIGRSLSDEPYVVCEDSLELRTERGEGVNRRAFVSS